MTRYCFVRLVPAGACLLLLLGFAGQSAAQTAQRTAADAPSRNRETIVQHDSLAVHFLRSPKAKPAARRLVSSDSPSSAKFRGHREPVQATLPSGTPLPTKKTATKR